MRQMKYKAAKAGALAAVLAVSSPGAVLAAVPHARSVSWIQTAVTTRSVTSESRSDGPNVSDLMIEDNKEALGPKVENVQLSENQYADYGIYGESMGGYASFYATVGNQGITDQPVKVDFPKNLTYTLEKDGERIDYVNTQPLSETGTYQFRIQLISNPDRPLSEQVIYQSTFIFRIQPKLPETAAASAESAASGDSGRTSYSSDGWSTLFGGDTGSASGSLSGSSGGTSGTASETESSETLSGLPDELGSILEDLGGTNASDSPENPDEETPDEEEKDAASSETFWNSELGAEAERIEALGEQLGISVPNGMMVNGSVQMDSENLAMESSRITILKDGTEYALPADGEFSETGDYSLLYADDSNEKPVVYSFFIMPDAISRDVFYTIPQDVSLQELTKDDKVLPVSQFQDSFGTVRLELSEEGFYTLLMQDKDRKTYTTSFAIDRTPPELSIENGNGTAAIHYDSSDVRKLVLRSGDEEQVYTSLEEVTKHGTYTLEAYDDAGNQTTISFRVKKSVNKAAVIAVILVFVLLGAGIVFVRRIKSNMDVK